MGQGYPITNSFSHRVDDYDKLNRKPPMPIVDEIDRVLAEHYGITDEELDFIINHDIKYRMELG